MQKINSETSLRAAIVLLEAKQAEEEKLLKAQLHLAYEGMKPINLIKGAFKEVTQSQELKDNLLNTAIGFGTGYLSKLLFQGFTKNPVKKLFGTVLEFSITNVVAKNPGVIKTLGNGLFKIIRNKANSRVHTVPPRANRSRLDLI